MQNLKTQLARLSTRPGVNQGHLAYRAVTNKIAAFLFPDRGPSPSFISSSRSTVGITRETWSLLGHTAIDSNAIVGLRHICKCSCVRTPP